MLLLVLHVPCQARRARAIIDPTGIVLLVLLAPDFLISLSLSL